MKIITWIVKCISVVILVQTLFFKFTAAEESVYIFTKLGIEPIGRIGSGIIELLAAVLILLSRTTLLGAILSLITMIGALLSHIFFLGIVVENDGGELFVLAIITLLCSLFLIYQNKTKIPNLLRFQL